MRRGISPPDTGFSMLFHVRQIGVPDMLSMVRNAMAFSWLMIFVLCLATLFLAASYVRPASVEGLR